MENGYLFNSSIKTKAKKKRYLILKALFGLEVLGEWKVEGVGSKSVKKVEGVWI